jgi:hypothetical protein
MVPEALVPTARIGSPCVRGDRFVAGVDFVE